MPPKAPKKSVNLQELAASFGISIPTAQKWTRQKDMPILRRGTNGSPWEFNLPDVIAWRNDLIKQEAKGDLSNIDAIKTERERVGLERERLKYAQEAGLVAPLDQMERRLSLLFAELRTTMLNIPRRTASMLLGETNEARYKEVLSEEIRRNLATLADFDLTQLDESLDDAANKQDQ